MIHDTFEGCSSQKQHWGEIIPKLSVNEEHSMSKAVYASALKKDTCGDNLFVL